MPEFVDRRMAAKSFAGFLVAALLFYLFSRVLSWRRVLGTLVEADAGWVALACASSLVGLAIWAVAWDRVLTSISVDIPLARLVPTYYAATFADYVTPFGKAGGGPFVAYVLSTDERASYEEGLASVVTADGLNLLPFFTFAGVGVVALGASGDVPTGIRPLVYGLGAMALGLPLLGYVLWRNERRVVWAVTRVGEAVSDRVGVVDAHDLEARVVEFFSLLDDIGESRAQLWETLGLAYLGWVFFAAPLWFAAQALAAPVSPLLVAFVVPASAMASFVPTPGGLGGVEAAIVGLLVALAGLPVHVAAAVALLYRAVSYWFVLLVGGAAAFWVVSRQ